MQNFRSAKEIIWHRRLGHYYTKDLNKCLKLHNVDENFCNDCKIAKNEKKSAQQRNTKSL